MAPAAPPAAPVPPSVAPAPRQDTGTAPLPGTAAIRPPSSPNASAASGALTREPARDTLAPSSFGVLGGSKPHAAPSPQPMRGARPAMNTLHELEGATATATLRPPGAVPPPPRALPVPTPSPDVQSMERAGALETPLPEGVVKDSPLTPLAAAPLFAAKPRPAAVDAALESTLDMNSTASKKATQAALVEQTRISGGTPLQFPAQPVVTSPPATAAPPSSIVPAPGLFIADEPLEPRPKLASVVTVERQVLTRMRAGVLLLGGLFLMAVGALVVMIFRRSEASASRAPAPSASVVAAPPGCSLSAPPSRISPIERAVPISAVALGDGSIALGIADTKTTATGFIYDPTRGEPSRKLESPPGTTDVSHVSASEPLVVDRASPDFAFGQTLASGLALGVGPAGLLRRGDDGATGVVWPLATGVRVTPPRVVSVSNGYFVAFRQGGAEGQISAGWLKADGSAAGDAQAIVGAPKTLGTPNVALAGQQELVLFSARNDKSEPYRVYVASAAPGQHLNAARALDLPTDGGGAIAPSLATLPNSRYLVQWTDGNVGQYQVHVRIFDASLAPVSEPLLVSAKGANAGQGTLVSTSKAIVSFFIQTTAGHDELWGVPVTCH